MRNKTLAFTLAEVLITLGIIGIVAAMTLPALVGNHKKNANLTALKKSYSALTQAVTMSELQNGQTGEWEYSLAGKEFYDRYLKAYLNTVLTSTYSAEKARKYKYYFLNGLECDDSGICSDSSYKVMLEDGSILTFSDYPSAKYKAFVVDVNGYRSPNTFGKDLFLFSIIPDYGVVPYGFKYSANVNQQYDSYKREQFFDASLYESCNKNNRGYFCAALVMTDGWTFKEDYPGY